MEGRGKHSNLPSKGAAMSFGFKPQVPSTQTNFNKTPITTEKKETAIDINVNNQTTARSGTPRLARPKKDTNGNCGARTNRFGFRSPVTPLSNKVADSQTNEAPSLYINYTENNSVTELKSSLKLSSSKSNASDSSHSTCSTGSDENNKQSKTNVQGIPKLQSATRFTLHTSHLPRPQFPVRLVTPANYHSTDKNAKTAANKVQQKTSKAQSENGGSSASSVTDADSGVGSQKSGTDIETQGIEHLDESPSAKNKLRNSNSVKKSRPMEMVFTNNQKKTFELRELNDAIEVTEIVPLQLPPLPHHRTQPNGMVRERALAYQQTLRDKIPQNDQQLTFSSDEDECFDESFGDEPCGEEKQHRDRMLSEKNEKGCIGAGESEAEELWGGVGEAMICDDDLANPSCADNNQEGIDSMNPPLRSVLLTIEDPAFATLAAMSSSAMIEDETSPDFSSSPPSSAAELPITQPSLDSNKKNLAGNTPESPGTPTHASNSLSLSEGRDFLIDDEIADQPGLVFDEGTSSGNFTTANSSGNTIVPEEMIDHIPEHHDNSITDGHVPSKTPRKMSHISEDCSPAHNASVGTLSSCESIASDDLMLDFDPSETNSTFGDNLDTRLEVGRLSEKDEETLRMIQDDDVLREWSSRLASGLGNGVRATRLLRPRVGSSGSGGTESPRSVTLDSQRLRSSPLRTSRQGTSSPGEDLSEDSGIRLDRETYQDMFQDVINIKTVLLRLKRVFQNQETENAFENSLQNGLYYNLGHDGATEEISNPKKDAEVADELADLRRQVVFLQQQLKEKDRVIQTLQESITRLKETREDKHNLEVTRETCNAATQTERIRPVSSGPSLLQGLPNDGAGGSLVSFRLGKQYE